MVAGLDPALHALAAFVHQCRPSSGAVSCLLSVGGDNNQAVLAVHSPWIYVLYLLADESVLIVEFWEEYDGRTQRNRWAATGHKAHETLGGNGAAI